MSDNHSDARRELELSNLKDVLAECHRLIDQGYTRRGTWTLGQMCRHLRITIEATLNGYPAWMMLVGLPLRPFLRRFMLPRLLKGHSPTSLPTAGMFVPPNGLDDRKEVDALEECVQAFQSHSGPLSAHPGFGNMTKQESESFHTAHSVHHLRFLIPNVD